MTGYGFFRTLHLFAGLALMIAAGLVICVWFICSEISTEREFKNRFGAGWRTEYESVHGPLSEARAKSVMSGVGLIAISGVTVWLWRILRGSSSAGANRRRHRHSHKSHLERIMIYRRNALLGIYFGLPGIFLGALFVIFRWGIFADHANEVVLGMFVFLAGYAGIIVGCACWLKAKEWNEALVIIGLLPLAILFIPFVRLLLFAEPLLLPVGMFMMSLILIVVVFALPDKSGVGRGMRHQHRSRSSRRSRHADSVLSGSQDDERADWNRWGV
jgi:hypothetical protein